MPFINVHPAPGLGELTPGWFIVPNNPFQLRQPVARTTGVGELVAAHWTLPQNPLANQLATIGLPPGQSSQKAVIQGLGAIDLGSEFSSWANPGEWTFSQWALVIGVGALFLLTMRKDRAGYKAAKLQAKADYYRALQDARSKHKTLGGRAVDYARERRAAAAAAAARAAVVAEG
jgi:hypothetical protein